MLKKYFLSATCLISLFLLSTNISFAASSDTIKITVLIQNLSISVVETVYDFGIMGLGSSKVSAAPGISVKNDGNVPTTVSISCTNTTAWIVGSPGIGSFGLSAQFDSDGLNMVWTPITNFNINTLPQKSSATKFAGDQNGINIQPLETRTLWFYLQTPTQTADFSPQAITVTFTAEVPL